MNLLKQSIPAAISSAILLSNAFLTGQAHAAIPFVDQSNTAGSVITTGTLTPGQSLAQSFTPSFSGIDLFAIRAFSNGVSSVQLNLLSGQTTSGSPIATSSTIVISNTTIENIEFQFPATVSLLPGAVYTARVDLLSGASYRLAFSTSNPYSGGFAFNEFGSPSPTVDWVFTEGLIVPEPFPIVLCGMAILGLTITWRAPRR